MAALARKQQAIKDLTQFLTDRGGTVSSADVGAFYTKHKKHREILPDLRMFCERQPDHFAIVDPGKGHWKLCLAISDKEAVQKLTEFISARGGLLCSRDFPDFKGQYPDLAKVVYSGGRTLRQFCELHDKDFVVDASESNPSVCIRLKSQEKEIVTALVKLLKESGGIVPSSKLKDFQPSVPDLRAFCEKYPARFAISASAGSWKLLLAPSEKEAAQKLADFIESQSGAQITSGDFGGFKKQEPAAAQVIRLGDRKLSEFCAKHCATFLLKAEGSGLSIRLQPEVQKARGAKEKKLLADIGKFLKEEGLRMCFGTTFGHHSS